MSKEQADEMKMSVLGMYLELHQALIKTLELINKNGAKAVTPTDYRHLARLCNDAANLTEAMKVIEFCVSALDPVIRDYYYNLANAAK